MVSAEQHKKCRSCGWYEDQPVLVEGVGVEQATPGLPVAHGVLLLLSRSVEDGEVEIRAGVVLRHVARVGAEQLVRHKRSKREGHRGVAIGMGLPLYAIGRQEVDVTGNA